MDIHPIFVHFPIALLIIYAMMELLRFKKLTENDSWNLAKVGIVIIGTLFAFVTLSTGEGAEHALRAKGVLDKPLVEMHSTFAGVATIIFTILAAAYLVWAANKFFPSLNKMKNKTMLKIWKFKLKVQSIVLSTPIAVILAFLGLIAMTITGALGGAIVYGPDIDPMVSIVYRMFF